MNPAPLLPRLRPVAGGWLLARDLADTPRLPALRLAQHQIAAHRTWGVSAGLLVMADDGTLTVTAGCAIDRCGRLAILPDPVTRPLRQQTVSVVLRVRGDGPVADLRLVARDAVADLDIPLATVDSKGVVHDGDGERRWAHRPGPARTFGGTVPRGAPVTGTAAAWTAHVDLRDHRLPLTPAVMATSAGHPPEGASQTTVEVTNQQPDGFDVVVRQAVVDRDPPAGAVLTAPHALTWLALLPAARPEFPSKEWS